MTYQEFENLSETEQLEITANYLTEYEVVTNDEYSLVISINGYNLDTVNSMLYTRTGYRSYSQLLDEE